MDLLNGKKIYEGKHSIVFLLEHKGEKFIVKQLHPRHYNNHLEIDKFRKEALFPSVEDVMPPVLDYKESSDNYFIIKKFVDGFTLDKIHQKHHGRKSHDLYKNIYDGLANKLQILHNHGIIHGDIKPSNIMVSDIHTGKNIWLLDAGLAIKKNNPPKKDLNTALPFSMLYGAPEVMLNEPSLVTELTDLFGVGICMYESFTGSVPYEANHPAILLQMMLSVLLKRKWRMNKNLFDIISVLTHKPEFKKPVAHYSVDEVSDYLEQSLVVRSEISSAHELQKKLSTIF